MYIFVFTSFALSSFYLIVLYFFILLCHNMYVCNLLFRTLSFFRVWVLHMFGSFRFPDGTGDSASWMYLPCLQDWDDSGEYSWGSAVLGYLYQQLCEACHRTRGTYATQSGCTYLLQV